MPEPPLEDDEDAADDDIVILEEDQERAAVRARADVLPNRIRENMPPATEDERRKIRHNHT